MVKNNDRFLSASIVLLTFARLLNDFYAGFLIPLLSYFQTAAVFRNPLAISIFDNEHSDYEDRSMTLGVSSTGNVLVVNHTLMK